jgi:hypothetical protein
VKPDGTSFKHPGQRHICSELLMLAENYFGTRVCHSRSRHLRHRCVSCPLSAVSIFQAFRLPCRWRQRRNPLHHAPKEPPREMALCQQQPVIARMFDQPCPLCQQIWGETASEDGGQPSDLKRPSSRNARSPWFRYVPLHGRRAGHKGCQHLWNARADPNPSGQPNPRKIGLLMGHVRPPIAQNSF